VFTVVVDRPGDRALELTPLQETVRYSSNAVGGFAAASFTIEGEAALRSERTIPFLSTIRIHHGSLQVWEGRVEDRKITIGGDTPTCQATAFGFKKLLEEKGVRRIWSSRSIPWQPTLDVDGLAPVFGTTPSLRTDLMFVSIGRFDPTAQSRSGVLVDNYTGVSGVLGGSNWAIYVLPPAINPVRTHARVATILGAKVYCQDSPDGRAWQTVFAGDPLVSGEDVYWEHSGGARMILVGSMSDGLGGNNGSFENIRVLCTTVREDEDGGIFGGTILRDLVAQIPGLGVGAIEDGSEFALPSIGRPLRDTALSVLEEVAAFYERQWAVWEGPSLYWRGSANQEPTWAVPLETLADFELDLSVAEMPRTTYVLFEDAASGAPDEASAVSTSQRNPYAVGGSDKGLLLQAPVVMTDRSAAALAQRVSDDAGRFPQARGSCSLPADTMVAHVSGARRPAVCIRGGDAIVIPGLPKIDSLTPGRDGQTVFQVSQAETDMRDNTVRLELDAYAKRSSVILARLAAVTRTVTG